MIPSGEARRPRNLESPLPGVIRAHFERAFGHPFDQARLVRGERAEADLARHRALALAVDARRILWSRRASRLDPARRLLLLGHELAHVVQLSRGGRSPEAALEAEAWRAAHAALAGRRTTVGGGATEPLAALCLIAAKGKLGSDTARYLAACPKLLGIRATTVEQLKPDTLSELLDRVIANADEQDLMIAAHGDGDGLFVNLDGQSGISALGKSLESLMEAGGLAGDADEDRRLIADELELDRARLDALVGKMRRVQNRNKRVNKLRFSVCTIGSEPATLESFRKFFNARSAAGPSVPSFFGSSGITIQAGSVAKKTAKARKNQYTYGKPGARITFQLYKDKPFHAIIDYTAADSNAAHQAFIDQHLMNGGKRTKKLLLHWLDLKPPVYPLDADYDTHVVHRPAK